MGSGTSTEHLDVPQRTRSSTVNTLSSRHAQPRLSCPNYLTSYDVKQLMRDCEEQRRNSTKESSSSTSDPLDEIHQQFYAPTPRKHSIASSHTPSGSNSPSSSDSGLGTPARQSLENLHWGQPLTIRKNTENIPQVEETPIVETPATPTIDVAKIFQRPLMKVQNRLQKKKQLVQRQRSQSLHPNQQFIIPGK